jgi:hypothetical protein
VRFIVDADSPSSSTDVHLTPKADTLGKLVLTLTKDEARIAGKLAGANVRYGSLAAAARSKWDVRFTPNSCRGFRRPARQLWVNSCRGAVKLGCLLYPRKLPRLSAVSAAAKGQKLP